MSRTNSLLLLVSALTLIGCGAAPIRERQRISSPLVGCPAEDILVTELGSWTWYAQCRQTAYRCTVQGRTEPICEELPSRGVATSVESTPPHAPPGVPEEPVQTSEGAEVRAAIDSRRDAIVACLDTLPVGIAVTIEHEGSAAVRLTGPNADPSAEACVRNVLEDLRLPDLREGQTTVHVLR